VFDRHEFAEKPWERYVLMQTKLALSGARRADVIGFGACTGTKFSNEQVRSMIGIVLVTHGCLAAEFRSALEHVVTTDKVSGVANQAAGKIKETAGKATGSEKLEAEGLAQQVGFQIILGHPRQKLQLLGIDRPNFDDLVSLSDISEPNPANVSRLHMLPGASISSDMA